MDVYIVLTVGMLKHGVQSSGVGRGVAHSVRPQEVFCFTGVHLEHIYIYSRCVICYVKISLYFASCIIQILCSISNYLLIDLCL